MVHGEGPHVAVPSPIMLPLLCSTATKNSRPLHADPYPLTTADLWGPAGPAASTVTLSTPSSQRVSFSTWRSFDVTLSCVADATAIAAMPSASTPRTTDLLNRGPWRVDVLLKAYPPPPAYATRVSRVWGPSAPACTRQKAPVTNDRGRRSRLWESNPRPSHYE